MDSIITGAKALIFGVIISGTSVSAFGETDALAVSTSTQTHFTHVDTANTVSSASQSPLEGRKSSRHMLFNNAQAEERFQPEGKEALVEETGSAASLLLYIFGALVLSWVTFSRERGVQADDSASAHDRA